MECVPVALRMVQRVLFPSSEDSAGRVDWAVDPDWVMGESFEEGIAGVDGVDHCTADMAVVVR